MCTNPRNASGCQNVARTLPEPCSNQQTLTSARRFTMWGIPIFSYNDNCQHVLGLRQQKKEQIPMSYLTCLSVSIWEGDNVRLKPQESIMSLHPFPCFDMPTAIPSIHLSQSSHFWSSSHSPPLSHHLVPLLCLFHSNRVNSLKGERGGRWGWYGIGAMNLFWYESWQLLPNDMIWEGPVAMGEVMVSPPRPPEVGLV